MTSCVKNSCGRREGKRSGYGACASGEGGIRQGRSVGDVAGRGNRGDAAGPRDA